MVCRATGFQGPADLIAWDTTSIRFISAKSGTRYASATEREGPQRMRRGRVVRLAILWRSCSWADRRRHRSSRAEHASKLDSLQRTSRANPVGDATRWSSESRVNNRSDTENTAASPQRY